MKIDKEKVWRYMNVSDGVAIACFALGILFFREDVLKIAGVWGVAFLCSGLGLRRYCKSEKMMRFGVHSDVDEDDEREIMSSYNHHVITIIISSVLIVLLTAYHLYESFI